jgi:hypothetical protein
MRFPFLRSGLAGRASATVPAVLAFLGLLSCAPARAEILTLHHSGTFAPGSALGGVPFAANTPFTFHAVFDSTADSDPFNGYAIFDTVVTFEIPGYGTFTSDPAGNVNINLRDASLPSGFYAAGLVAVGAMGEITEGFYAAFSTATPPSDADAPMPTVMSVFAGWDGGPLTIPLTGGAGDLFFSVNSASFGPTATITGPAQAAIPEPGTLALLLVGTLTMGAGVLHRGACAPRRRKRTEGV